MGQPVVMFEIEGMDGARLRAFYEGMFGWRADVLADNPAEYALISAEQTSAADGRGIGGAIAQVPEVPSTTWRGPTRAEGRAGEVTIFVEVPDVEEALQRAEALGGERMLGPDEVQPGTTIGRFADPEGHLIGVVATAPPGA